MFPHHSRPRPRAPRHRPLGGHTPSDHGRPILDPTNRMPDNRRPIVLAALCLCAFAINLDTTIVNVALPTLVRELHASSTRELQWIVDAYNLSSPHSCSPPAASATASAARAMLLAGLAVFGLASGARRLWRPHRRADRRALRDGRRRRDDLPDDAVADHERLHRARERARAIGLWGAITGMAIAVGPIVGGWLLEHFAWGSDLLRAWSPVAALAVAARRAARCRPRATPRRRARPPRPGALDRRDRARSIYTIIEAPEPRLGLRARRSAGFAASGRTARRVRRPRAPHARTRCSTCACSATCASRPRAAR